MKKTYHANEILNIISYYFETYEKNRAYNELYEDLGLDKKTVELFVKQMGFNPKRRVG